MIGILEIILTIAAWRKGWRWRALLPVGGGLAAAFMIGLMAGAVGFQQTQIKQLQIALLPLDFAAIGTLIWMCAKGRKQTVDAVATLEADEPHAVKQAA